MKHYIMATSWRRADNIQRCSDTIFFSFLIWIPELVCQPIIIPYHLVAHNKSLSFQFLFVDTHNRPSYTAGSLVSPPLSGQSYVVRAVHNSTAPTLYNLLLSIIINGVVVRPCANILVCTKLFSAVQQEHLTLKARSVYHCDMMSFTFPLWMNTVQDIHTYLLPHYQGP